MIPVFNNVEPEILIEPMTREESMTTFSRMLEAHQRQIRFLESRQLPIDLLGI